MYSGVDLLPAGSATLPMLVAWIIFGLGTGNIFFYINHLPLIFRKWSSSSNLRGDSGPAEGSVEGRLDRRIRDGHRGCPRSR